MKGKARFIAASAFIIRTRVSCFDENKLQQKPSDIYSASEIFSRTGISLEHVNERKRENWKLPLITHVTRRNKSREYFITLDSWLQKSLSLIIFKTRTFTVSFSANPLQIDAQTNENKSSKNTRDYKFRFDMKKNDKRFGFWVRCSPPKKQKLKLRVCHCIHSFVHPRKEKEKCALRNC